MVAKVLTNITSTTIKIVAKVVVEVVAEVRWPPWSPAVHCLRADGRHWAAHRWRVVAEGDAAPRPPPAAAYCILLYFFRRWLSATPCSGAMPSPCYATAQSPDRSGSAPRRSRHMSWQFVPRHLADITMRVRQEVKKSGRWGTPL